VKRAGPSASLAASLSAGLVTVLLLGRFAAASTTTDLSPEEMKSLADYMTEAMDQWNVDHPKPGQVTHSSAVSGTNSMLSPENQQLRSAMDEVLSQGALLHELAPMATSCPAASPPLSITPPISPHTSLAVPHDEAQPRAPVVPSLAPGIVPGASARLGFGVFAGDVNPYGGIAHTDIQQVGRVNVTMMNFDDRRPSVLESDSFTENLKPNDSDISRNWTFYSYGNTRQDAHLLLHDNGPPDASEFHSPSTSVYFFPRRVPFSITRVGERGSPSTHSDGDEGLNVILSTGEVAQYDQNNHLRAGVLSVSPISRSAADNRPASHLKYSGSGVMLTISARGRAEPEDGGSGRGAGTRDPEAVLTKVGSPPCHIAPDLLFKDVSGGLTGVGPFAEFRFPDDATFDAFLKTHCGFSFSW
jgi:hypothetical protein